MDDDEILSSASASYAKYYWKQMDRLTANQLDTVATVSFSHKEYTTIRGDSKFRAIQAYLESRLPKLFKLAIVYYRHESSNKTVYCNDDFFLVDAANVDEGKEQITKLLKVQGREVMRMNIIKLVMPGTPEFNPSTQLPAICEHLSKVRDGYPWLTNPEYQKYLKRVCDDLITLLGQTHKPHFAYYLWQLDQANRKAKDIPEIQHKLTLQKHRVPDG